MNLSTLVAEYFVNFKREIIDPVAGLYSEATVDALGRYHAPFDGFTLFDKVYLGGEYIEMRESDKDIFSSSKSLPHNTKVKIEFDTVEVLKGIEFAGYLIWSVGTSWDERGIKVCYAYIKSNQKDLMDLVVNAIRFVSEREIKLLDEGKQTLRGKLVKIDIELVRTVRGDSGRTVALFVNEDGVMFKGTLSAKMPNVLGSIIEFDATITNSQYMSFYKRPSKVKVISLGEV